MTKVKTTDERLSKKVKQLKMAKSKAKLKSLLDTKGIQSPVASQLGEGGDLYKRVLPKHVSKTKNAGQKVRSPKIKKENVGKRNVQGEYAASAKAGQPDHHLQKPPTQVVEQKPIGEPF